MEDLRGKIEEESRVSERLLELLLLLVLLLEVEKFGGSNEGEGEWV